MTATEAGVSGKRASERAGRQAGRQAGRKAQDTLAMMETRRGEGRQREEKGHREIHQVGENGEISGRPAYLGSGPVRSTSDRYEARNGRLLSGRLRRHRGFSLCSLFSLLLPLFAVLLSCPVPIPSLPFMRIDDRAASAHIRGRVTND
jgi:hypothetical protein